MPRKLTNEEFLQRIKDCGTIYIPLEEYKGNNKTPIKFWCPIHKIEFEKAPHRIIDGCGKCPECLKIHIRDKNAYDEHPEIHKYFEDPNILKNYAEQSGTPLEVRCPICGAKKITNIQNLVHQGFHCDVCDLGGLSYGNKFLRGLIPQLNVDYFKYEKYIKVNNVKYFFDVYFEKDNKKFVIEMDGLQHRKDIKTWGGLEKISRKDKIKNKIAKDNAWILIRVPVNKQDYNEIKNCLLQSELINHFDLSNIDWKKCHELSLDNITKRISDMYNSLSSKKGIVEKISKEIGFSVGFVINSLKRGELLGWNDYSKTRVVGNGIEFICKDKDGNLIGKFTSIKEGASFLRKTFNINIDVNTIKVYLDNKPNERKRKYDLIFEKIE